VVDVIATEGEARVLANMRSKADRAAQMFEQLVAQMNDATTVTRTNLYTNNTKVPQWL
jgi:hypothetical protein